MSYNRNMIACRTLKGGGVDISNQELCSFMDEIATTVQCTPWGYPLMASLLRHTTSPTTYPVIHCKIDSTYIVYILYF